MAVLVCRRLSDVLKRKKPPKRPVTKSSPSHVREDAGVELGSFSGHAVGQMVSASQSRPPTSTIRSRFFGSSKSSCYWRLLFDWHVNVTGLKYILIHHHDRSTADCRERKSLITSSVLSTCKGSGGCADQSVNECSGICWFFITVDSTLVSWSLLFVMRIMIIVVKIPTKVNKLQKN